MRRTLVSIVCGLGLVLAGCSDPVADELAAFDPAEVRLLRDEAAAEGIERDDEALVALLEYRRSCRAIRSGLDDFEAGATPDSVADELEPLIVVTFEEKQPETAEHNQTLVDALRRGDPASLQRNHRLHCANVT